MATPEEIAAAEAAKAKEDEAAKIAAEAKAKADEEAKKAAEEVFDKDRAMATIKAQRAENADLKKNQKELERLQAEERKRADADLSETERLKKANAELEAENAKVKADNLRRDVIAEVGLPATFTDRLKGITREELMADATDLLKTMPQLKIVPKLKSTNPPGPDTSETDAQRRERILGKPINPFDIETIKANGGGVIWNVPKDSGGK